MKTKNKTNLINGGSKIIIVLICPDVKSREGLERNLRLINGNVMLFSEAFISKPLDSDNSKKNKYKNRNLRNYQKKEVGISYTNNNEMNINCLDLYSKIKVEG